MVRVIRFQPPPISSGMTGWKLRTFCVLPRSPTPKSTLSWNGTLIRSAIGFCACFASASVPPPASSARACRPRAPRPGGRRPWRAAACRSARGREACRAACGLGLVAVVAARPGALERGRDVPRSRGRLGRRLLGVLTLVLDAPGHRGAPFQVAPAAAILREPLLRRRRAGRQRGGQAGEDQPARTGAHPQRLELHHTGSLPDHARGATCPGVRPPARGIHPPARGNGGYAGGARESSTRRFCARPFGVSFDAIGLLSPYPWAASISGLKPCDARKSLTSSARLCDSTSLLATPSRLNAGPIDAVSV